MRVRKLLEELKKIVDNLKENENPRVTDGHMDELDMVYLSDYNTVVIKRDK